jgi:hypothetical protein
MALHNVVMSRGFRAGALGLAVALSLGLAGCNSGESPGQGGTTTPASTSLATTSASPTPTPSPTAAYKPADASGPAQNVPVPVMPEVAKTETKEGLEAFTKYWFEQLNYAYQTGDVAGVTALTSPNCEFCSNITNSLTTNYREERWLVGGKLTVPAVSTTFDKSADGNYQVVIQVLQETISYREASGAEFRAATEPSNTGNVLLVGFQDSAWRVNGLHPLR